MITKRIPPDCEQMGIQTSFVLLQPFLSKYRHPPRRLGEERNRESFLSSNSLSGFYFYFFSPLPRSRVSFFFFSLAHLPLFIRLLSLFLFSCFFFSLSRAEIVSFPELTDLRISCLELLPLLKYALQDVLAHPRTVRFFTCKWFGF